MISDMEEYIEPYENGTIQKIVIIPNLFGLLPYLYYSQSKNSLYYSALISFILFILWYVFSAVIGNKCESLRFTSLIRLGTTLVVFSLIIEMKENANNFSNFNKIEINFPKLLLDLWMTYQIAVEILFLFIPRKKIFLTQTEKQFKICNFLQASIGEKICYIYFNKGNKGLRNIFIISFSLLLFFYFRSISLIVVKFLFILFVIIFILLFISISAIVAYFVIIYAFAIFTMYKQNKTDPQISNNKKKRKISL